MPHPRSWRASTRRKLVIASAVSGLGFCAQAPHADTTAEWIGGTGNWTTASNWSTNPNYPNNGTPSGTNYQAIIDQPESAEYVIIQSGNNTVDSISLSSTNAALVDISGTMTIGGMAISGGTFRLQGGILSGGTSGALVTLTSSSQFTIFEGTLNGISFSGADLNVGTSAFFNVYNGLSLSGYSLNIAGGDILSFQNSLTIDKLAINSTSSNQAQLQVNGSNGTTVTLGSNALVHGNVMLGQTASSSYQFQIVNNGTVSADLSSGSVSVNMTYFLNNAQMNAINGSTLAINSQKWTNTAAATITANNSTLNLGGTFTNQGSITTIGSSTVNLSGTFTLANLGNYTPSTNTVTNIDGTLDNTGQTLTLAGVTGQWFLNQGTILNGNLNCGTNMYVVNGTLSGVTNSAGNVIDVQYLDDLTMAGSWNNAGIIQATGAATINLGGTFSPSNIGTLNIAPNTDVNITGSVLNNGNNFTWNNGTWLMVGGTFYGGQLTVPNGQHSYPSTTATAP